jgi:inorganic pyrophosphatase/exopolyphosphatase
MAGKLQLTLVDHHVLSPETEFLRTSVVEIIDHHPQDLAWLWPEQKVTLTKVGSCSTLVANKVVQRCPQLLSCQVAMLLYGEYTASHHFLVQVAGALFFFFKKQRCVMRGLWEMF